MDDAKWLNLARTLHLPNPDADFRHLAVRTRDALHATISKKITILAVFPLVCCNYSIILYYHLSFVSHLL